MNHDLIASRGMDRAQIQSQGYASTGAMAAQLGDSRSPLERAIDEASDGLNDIEAQITELQNRLHPVLRSETPTPPMAGNGLAAVQQTSSLATERVLGLGARARALATAIAGLRSRLDT